MTQLPGLMTLQPVEDIGRLVGPATSLKLAGVVTLLRGSPPGPLYSWLSLWLFIAELGETLSPTLDSVS